MQHIAIAPQMKNNHATWFDTLAIEIPSSPTLSDGISSTAQTNATPTTASGSLKHENPLSNTEQKIANTNAKTVKIEPQTTPTLSDGISSTTQTNATPSTASGSLKYENPLSNKEQKTTNTNAKTIKIEPQTTPLSPQQLAIASVAFSAAQGDLSQLERHLEQALNAGLTQSEVQEIFIHQAAYAGFPRALNGLLTLQNLLKNRLAQGIQDPVGEHSPIDHQKDYYQQGVHTLNALNGRDNSALLWQNEGIDYALKAYLFGYLFNRPELSPVNREIITVSTLIALETVPRQLRSHLTALQRLGISHRDLQRLIQHITPNHPTAQKQAEAVLTQSP